MKKVYIYNTNKRCLENALDTGRIREYFHQNSWLKTDNPKKADLIVVNTCAYNQFREDQSIKSLSNYLDLKPSDKILVCGCLPEINSKRLKSVFDGKSIPPKNIDTINEFIGAKKELNKFDNNKLDTTDFYYTIRSRILIYLSSLYAEFSSSKSTKKPKAISGVYRKNTFYIKIAEGCLGNCSYCAIKNARGRVRSRPMQDILQEFKNGKKSGHNHFVLLGEDTGAYGLDINTSFVDLLKELLLTQGSYNIGINNLNPNWLIKYDEDLTKQFKSGKISSILIPLQSGNNRILNLMNRNYNVEEFRRAYKTIRKEVPGMMINTHIMVGFPSETESEYKDSVAILNNLKFDNVATFKYTNRPGTKASTMIHQLTPKAKNRRYKKLALKYWFSSWLY